jgi:hypothetical protein
MWFLDGLLELLEAQVGLDRGLRGVHEHRARIGMALAHREPPW